MTATIAIVSDTHMPKGARELPEECVRICREADLIIHGGDFMEASVLELFKSFGPPVVAVHGNVDSKDLRNWLPETTTIEVESARLGLIHDSGPKKGRLARMRALFPDHDAVIFGHSHLPLHEQEDGFQIFNPGSPTERRRSPFKSMGVASVNGGQVDFQLIDLGGGPGPIDESARRIRMALANRDPLGTGIEIVDRFDEYSLESSEIAGRVRGGQSLERAIIEVFRETCQVGLDADQLREIVTAYEA